MSVLERTELALRYTGARVGGRAQVWVEVPGKGPVELPNRLELRNHSPTGFEWGYGGSGPGQLALAICVHAAGERTGLRVYQDFKSRVVARIQADAWDISRQEVLDVIRQIVTEHEQEGRR